MSFRRKHIEGEEGRVAAVAPGSLAGRGNVLDCAAAAIDDIRGVFAKDAVNTGVVACEYRLGNKELLLPPYAEGHRLAWLLQQ